MRKHGQGACSIIYQLEEKHTHQLSVMKKYHSWSQTTQTPPLEYTIMHLLRDCPFICNVQDYFVDHENFGLDSPLCITMDFYPETLLERIEAIHWRDNVLTGRQIQTWLYQLTCGLAAMHAKGFIHNDIKPSNLFLDREKNIRIGDFDRAKVVQGDSDQQQTRVTDWPRIGTLAYMAPERKHGSCSTKSDMWALGCVLQDMLTLSPMEVKHMQGDMGSRERREEELFLYQIVKNLTSNNASERMTAGDLIRHLQQFENFLL
jgi:serine/threonine protein kinase